jgi:hypothetical protein
MSEMSEAHVVIRDTAIDLEKRGIARSSIVDALISIGINSGIGMSSPDQMADFLEKMAALVRAGHPVDTRH